MPKFKLDLAKVEVPKPVYAGAGVADIVVETYKEYADTASKKVTAYQKDVTARLSGAQKSVASFEPKTLSSKLTAEAKARRAALEARVSELQTEALSLPGKATDTYEGLAKRGEKLVAKLRGSAPVVTATATTKSAAVKQTAPARKAAAKKTSAKKAPAARKTTAKKPA